MPRTARKKGSTGIYHIVMRGINRKNIFEDAEDKERFIQTLIRYKSICGFELFAYCIMDNHLHLLLRVIVEPLDQIMRRVCGSFVYWYNQKYERIGNLFQDRFRSEPVDDEAYFLTVLRYIHQNPIKAGLIRELGQYHWSSYKDYFGGPSFIDANFALSMFHDNPEKSITAFESHQSKVVDEACLDIEEKPNRINDEEAKEIIKQVCNVSRAGDLQRLEKRIRDAHLQEIMEKHGLTIRQISRLTGISRGVVYNVRRSSQVPRP